MKSSSYFTCFVALISLTMVQLNIFAQNDIYIKQTSKVRIQQPNNTTIQIERPTTTYSESKKSESMLANPLIFDAIAVTDIPQASEAEILAYKTKLDGLLSKLENHPTAPFFIDPNQDFKQICFNFGKMSQTTLQLLNEKTDSLDVYFSKTRYRPEETNEMYNLFSRIATITQNDVRDKIKNMYVVSQYFATPTINYVNTSSEPINGSYKSYFITAPQYRSCDFMDCSSSVGDCSSSCLTSTTSPFSEKIHVSSSTSYYHVFVTKTIGNIERIVGYQRVVLSTDTDFISLRVSQ